MPMPNFLIIGVEKAGTTSVYHYLKQHPQVFVSPIKETNFFVYDGGNPRVLPYLRKDLTVVKSLDEYRGLFQGGARHQASGEASPLYSIDPYAADRIRHHIPNTKLIALLRDPVERAYSAYWMRRRDGAEGRSFEQAVWEELSGQHDDSVELERRHYVRWGFYARHLRAYLKAFDRSQLAVYLFDDLKADASGLMRDMYRFLEVDDSFVPDTSIRYNASGVPRFKLLGPLFGKSAVTRAIKCVLPASLAGRAAALQETWRSHAVMKPRMPVQVRERLVERYRGDILQTQDIIGRDLSGWLQ